VKAIICREYGPISGLEFADVEDPVPGPRDVVIDTEVIGVNYPDGLLVQGLYQAKPPLPFIPGMEAVGRVAAAGAEVTSCKVGDRVGVVSGAGAYAQKVKAAANSVIPLPEGMEAGAAAALMCGYGTALHALRQRAELKAGETLAVTGAAGLTGLAAVQIGKAMGARVIAIASTEEKRRIAQANGADEVLGYDNLRERLKEVTGGTGVDVVFDVVGGNVFDDCARAMAWNGRLLVIGFTSGEIPKFPVNLALVKGFSVVGVFWGTFARVEPEANILNIKQLFSWHSEGKVAPHIESAYPLAEAAKALEFIHSRRATGKVLLEP
jgi:NADPH:quinone reductase